MIRVTLNRGVGSNPLHTQVEEGTTIFELLKDKDINPNEHSVLLNGEEVDVRSVVDEDDRITLAEGAENPTLSDEDQVQTAGKVDGGC